MSWLLVIWKNNLIRKIRLITKFMTSEPGKETIAIHSKCSQNVVEKLFSGSFLKNYQNWAYLLINSLKFYTVCFYCMPKWGISKYIEIKLQATCFHLIQIFCNKKMRSTASISASLSAWYFKRNTFLIIFYYLSKFYCLVPFTSWDIGQYMYCNYLLTRL